MRPPSAERPDRAPHAAARRTHTLLVLAAASLAAPIPLVAQRPATPTTQPPSATGAGARDPDAPALRRRARWDTRIAPPTSDSGAVVRAVTEGSAAARAGLRAGDRIVRLGDVAVAGPAVPGGDAPGAFWPAFRAIRGGDDVRLTVVRARAPRGDDTLALRFVADSLPHERIAGATVSYGVLVSARGHRVRTILTRPDGAADRRIPAILFVPWLSCGSVESPLPTGDGFARLFTDVAAQSGMALLRVEKPGVGDSEGPDCSRGDLEDELAAYRAALRALRARGDVDASRIVLLGGSIGGGLAPVLAAESPAGIIGVASLGGFAKTWYEHMLEIERRRLTLTGRSPAEVNAAMRGYARFYTDYLLGARTPAEVLAQHPELRPLWYDEPARQYGRPAAYYHQVQRLDVEGAWAALAARGVPGLVVWGEYDWIMSRDDQERAVAILNAARPGLGTLVVLPKTGHGLNAFPTLADAFADTTEVYDGAPSRAVLDWLRRVIAPR